MARGYRDLWYEQSANGTDPSDQEYIELLKQIRETRAELHRCVRLVSQTLLDCYDRMEGRAEFSDLTKRIDALGLYRLN